LTKQKQEQKEKLPLLLALTHFCNTLKKSLASSQKALLSATPNPIKSQHNVEDMWAACRSNSIPPAALVVSVEVAGIGSNI
jgi:hypothetical protein